VNAYSELAATLTPVVLVVLVLSGVPVPGLEAPFPTYLYAAVGYTTLVWVPATFLTRPTSESTLDRFYRQVRPSGPGWGPQSARHPDVEPDRSMSRAWANWALGCIFVYATLFGVGYLLLGPSYLGATWSIAAVVSGGWLFRRL
jgi:hypothetical protein